MAKPDIAQAVEQQVIQLASTGRLGRPVDDAMLRALLERIAPDRREVEIDPPVDPGAPIHGES